MSIFQSQQPLCVALDEVAFTNLHDLSPLLIPGIFLGIVSLAIWSISLRRSRFDIERSIEVGPNEITEVAVTMHTLTAVPAQTVDRYNMASYIYRQQYIGLVHNLALALGSLKSDVRYYVSNEAGDARAGKVDNRTLNALFSYTLGGHGVGLGYQGLSGSTAMPYVVGTDAYLTHYMLANDFMERDERSWQLRYSYDFAALGIPGLTFATRYTKADHANPATVAGEGREWERDTDLGYTFQGGALKNLGVLWRNAALRSSYLRDIDENRLIVSYTLPLF